MLSFLALWAVLQAPDVVHVRDGRRLEGRVHVYDGVVDVETPAGHVRVARTQVARIDAGIDFPLRPETVALPLGLLDKIEYSWASYRNILVAYPAPRHPLLLGLDVSSLTRAWEIDAPDRWGDPIVAGPWLVVLQRTRAPDEKRKLKADGAPFPAERHVITIRAFDAGTGRPVWDHSLENDERKDLYWTTADNPFPALLFLPDRLVLRFFKEALPVDKQGTVDPGRPSRLACFVAFDLSQRRILHRLDSAEAGDFGGGLRAAGDQILLQSFSGGPRTWKLAAVGAKDFKFRWQTDTLSGVLHEATEDWAYASDHERLFAVSLKTGKIAEKSFALDQAVVADVMQDVAVVTRRPAPRHVAVVDLRRWTEVARVPAESEPAYLATLGPRVLWADRQNRIHALDTVQKKEAWVWTGAGPGFVSGARVLGGGFAFYKDGRVTLLDPATGRKVWEVRGSYRSLIPAGDQGFLALRRPGMDVLRPRRLQSEAVFLTPAGVPLRLVFDGDATWSPPAVADGRLYTLSSGATAMEIDLATKERGWYERMGRSGTSVLTPISILGDVLAVHVGGDVVAISRANKGRLWEARFGPGGPGCPIDLQGGTWYSQGPGSALAAYEVASGRRLWESTLRGVIQTARVDEGRTLLAMTPSGFHRVDAATGTVGSTAALPRGASGFATDGRRTFVITGPYGFGEMSAAGVAAMRWSSKTADPKVGQRFKGAIALAPGGVLYSHADGGVAYVPDGAESYAWNFAAPEFTSDLLVHQGRVWFAAGGRGLVGVDLATGEAAWTHPAADASLFTPILWDGRPAFWCFEGWILLGPK